MPRYRLPLCAALLACSLAACETSDTTAPGAALAVGPAATFTVQALSIPAGAFTGEGSAINDAGVAVGWYRNNSGWTAVRWTQPNQMQNLSKLTGFASALAKDINLNGRIVGYALSASFLNSRAVSWTAAGSIRALADLGGGASLAQAVNNGGVAVGWAADPNGVTHAVQWSAAGVLKDLNPPGATSEALDINAAGDVVGWVFPAGGSASHAFLWRHDGVKIDLGTLGGPGSQAFGVNSALTIVGVSDQASPKPPTAFIWTAAGGMRTLRFGDNSQATGISDRARSAGFRIGTGVTGLTQIGSVTTTLPDLAPAKGHFSAPTAVNLCGTMVGSGASPVPTNGNSIPVIWKNSACD